MPSLFCFSIDATKPSDRLGRLVNDSGVGNCKMRKVIVDKVPHLCLFATQDIHINEELRYDYGLNDLPWRKQVATTSNFTRVTSSRKYIGCKNLSLYIKNLK